MCQGVRQGWRTENPDCVSTLPSCFAPRDSFTSPRVSTMAQKLPEELLRDIIGRVLHIPDDVLNDTRLPSPFAHVEFSTSLVLLVCKRWMRVGTTLLYKTIVLRTRPQALSLCNALKRNPAFASSIKRLRLEGQSAEVLGNARIKIQTLEQLCLALDYAGATKSNGLLKFMRSAGFNLSIIAITDCEGLHYDLKLSFHSMIKEILPSWDCLVRIFLGLIRLPLNFLQRTIVLPPIHARFLGLNPALIFRVVTDAAAHCSNLKQLHLTVDNLSELSVAVNPLLWNILYASPRCKLIISIPNATPSHIRAFAKRVDITLRTRVFVQTRGSFESCNFEAVAESIAKADVGWHNPLDNATPDIQTSIWGCIVDFATYADAGSFHQFAQSPWFDWNRFNAGTAKALLFTNRRLSVGLCVAQLPIANVSSRI